MRLLTWNSQDTFSLTTDLVDNIPPYAILSHTWGADGDEVTFADLQQDRARYKPGYAKIQFCGEQARRNGFQYFWVDTCCIDKANNSELTEAITSMYQWYHKAQKCYTYLADVSTRTDQPAWESAFRASRWFTRGWTLQELLASRVVEFYSREGDFLGTKQTLVEEIHEITTIPLAALYGAPLSQFPIKERIRWTESRQTKKKEDQAYCLLGIFDVFMPLIYGEGDNAYRRLQKEINERYGADVDASLRVADQVGSLGLCLNSAPVINSSEFVGRTLEIATIHELLRPDQAFMEQRRVVLGGIGGMGKTQLAIAYARQHQRSYASILWLNATSELALYASFRSIARRLITAEELARNDDIQLLIHVHKWLSQSQSTQWLLIFDNYDDPEQFSIDSFCPNTGHGSILVTTRLPDLVTGQQVRIQPLHAIDDSITVLQLRSGRPNTKYDQGAHLLAKRLAGLPLALVTAGAYLRKSVITFQQYLDAYDQRWQIDRRRQLQLPDYRNRTLYTTWDLTYRKLRADDLEAAQMLQLLAYFDNQDLWHAHFLAGLSDHAPAWLKLTLSEDSGFSSVMSTLVEYCLIEVNHATETYSMHNCVHDWVLGELNREINPQMYWYAFDCVAASVDEEDWQILGHIKYIRVGRHGVRLAHHRFEACDKSVSGLQERLDPAVWIADMLTEQAQYSAAERLYVRVLAEAEQSLGRNHTLTLDTIDCLGRLYNIRGKLDMAKQMFERALIGREEVLGSDNCQTLETVDSLGIVYCDLGELDEAEKMHERALAGKIFTLGLNHTSTLATINNLGDLHRLQGRFNKTEQMYQRVLVERENAHGPDHLLTLDAVHNLGALYYDQGKLDEAEQMYERALAGKEKVQTSDHPVLLETVNSLGQLYCARSRLNEAEQMYERAFAGRAKALGPNHPSTLATISDLGSLYRRQDKLKEAEQMFLRVFSEIDETLGSEHFLTLDAADKLVLLYSDQEKFEEAEKMNSRVLTIVASLPLKGDCQRPLIGYFVVQALRRSLQLNNIDRQSSMLRLLRSVKQWKERPLFCQQVGRAMVHCGDGKNAQEAYRYSVRRIHQQRADYHGTYCDGCSRRILVEMGLHVCRQCMEIDLCDQCMEGYNNGETVMAKCSGHDFFHVDKAVSVLSDDAAVDTTTEMIAWVDRAMAEYTLAGVSDVQND